MLNPQLSVVYLLACVQFQYHVPVKILPPFSPSFVRQIRGGNAGPLRCGKGTTWEGGQRVPGIAWWPGKIRQGKTVEVQCIQLCAYNGLFLYIATVCLLVYTKLLPIWWKFTQSFCPYSRNLPKASAHIPEICTKLLLIAIILCINFQ